MFVSKTTEGHLLVGSFKSIVKQTTADDDFHLLKHYSYLFYKSNSYISDKNVVFIIVITSNLLKTQIVTGRDVLELHSARFTHLNDVCRQFKRFYIQRSRDF